MSTSHNTFLRSYFIRGHLPVAAGADGGGRRLRGHVRVDPKMLCYAMLG